MKLSVGILAHNEEDVIAATISSLMAQSAFSDGESEVEVIVVANGCSDRTAEVATKALSRGNSARGSFRVVDLERAGKANAWNVFVHDASAKDADYLVLLDADIEFASPECLAILVRHLEAHPEILIAPDQPVKKFARSGPMSVLIRALQKSGSDDEHALSGQLYAARPDALRAVVMPLGVVVEDGFLRAMTLTRSFSESEDKSRIRRAPGVRHYYDAYETLASIWRYERRQAAGTTINRFLYDEFTAWRESGRDIAAETRRRNRETPDWIEDLIAEKSRVGGIILPPKNYAFRRLKRLRRLSFRDALKAPLYAAAIAYDVVVAIDASRQLRNRARRGARWDSIRSS